IVINRQINCHQCSQVRLSIYIPTLICEYYQQLVDIAPHRYLQVARQVHYCTGLLIVLFVIQN
ncbi:hypothetical protein CWC17_19220, partial [Pseudoalteromonas sp. S3785]|uniref:hypothetical protein n=1 Tax=Pseudoalteromonas sp. S3785 TaxID=579545 RepID=UPI001275A037